MPQSPEEIECLVMESRFPAFIICIGLRLKNVTFLKNKSIRFSQVSPCSINKTFS